MSTRMEWAQERLTEYLRGRETDELLAQLADVSHLEDRVCGLEGTTEALRDDVLDLERRVASHDEQLDELHEAAS